MGELAPGLPIKEAKNTLKLEVGAKTDVGKARNINEDSIFTPKDPNVHSIFVVADGMGGHEKGEVASQIATRQFSRFEIGTLTDHTGLPIIEIDKADETILSKTIQEANSKLVKFNENREEKDKAGTTVVALKITDKKATFANVGDSRGYVFSENARYPKRYHENKGPLTRLSQITKDHSLDETLRGAGQRTTEEIAAQPTPTILRSLGEKADVEVDTVSVDLKDGDVIMLCSDGLQAGKVSNERIEQVLADVSSNTISAQQGTDLLIKEANEGGGPDNISVIVVRVTDLQQSIIAPVQPKTAEASPVPGIDFLEPAVLNSNQISELKSAVNAPEFPRQQTNIDEQYINQLGKLPIYSLTAKEYPGSADRIFRRIARYNETLKKMGAIPKKGRLPDGYVAQICSLAVSTERSMASTGDVQTKQSILEKQAKEFTKIAHTEVRAKRFNYLLTEQYNHLAKTTFVGKLLKPMGVDGVVNYLYNTPGTRLKTGRVHTTLLNWLKPITGYNKRDLETLMLDRHKFFQEMEQTVWVS